MTDPHESIEPKLERLANAVSLRTREKDAARAHLQAFMAQGRKPVLSPYARLFGPGVRVASALMLFIFIGGTGIVSASGSAQPGSPLYVVKLKVAEPAQSAFILDPKEKTAFEVERTDRRLKELALVSRADTPDPAATALIADSLAHSLSDIAEDVDDFAASGRADEALEANADLQSVLSAHQRVLARVEEGNPELAGDFDAISDSVDAGLAATENAEQRIEDAVEGAGLDEDALSDQTADTEALRDAVGRSLEDATGTLDADDRTVISGGLADADSVIAEARAARDAGDRSGSYLLYTEANQALLELQTLIEADRALGIGIIGAGE